MEVEILIRIKITIYMCYNIIYIPTLYLSMYNIMDIQKSSDRRDDWREEEGGRGKNVQHIYS